MPVTVTYIEHTHECRAMQYTRRSCCVVSISRNDGLRSDGASHLIGTWKLLRKEEENFPQNLYIDYCPFCGEWLAADDRTAPVVEQLRDAIAQVYPASAEATAGKPPKRGVGGVD